MTYNLKNNSKTAAANIFLSSLLPLFSRLAVTLSGSPTSLTNPAKELTALTFLHDFIDSLELQKPAAMVVSAARQLAHLNPDSTLVLFSIKDQEKIMVVAGTKPSSLTNKEILELGKKFHTPKVTDATLKRKRLSSEPRKTLAVSAATEPGSKSGQLILYSTIRPTPKESQLINYCLQHLEKRLNETRNWQELEKANRIDNLTGLHNRRHFDEIIKKECERADRYHRPTSLIMLDLDYFKKVNDNFGHQTGDMVLEKLGKVMLAQVRHCDSPCRYGGEEFAIILPETGLFEAKRIAERLRREIERQNIVTHNNIHLKITASLGISSTEDICTFDLVAAADQALYRAKEGGRNQIATTPKAPRQTVIEPAISHCFPAQAVIN